MTVNSYNYLTVPLTSSDAALTLEFTSLMLTFKLDVICNRTK